MSEYKVKVSVVTACFNSMRFIEETWKSVRDQGVEDFEWIVVDDCSTDGTKEYLSLLEDIRINKIFFNANKGIGKAYKAGVENARGEYILILDHDDTVPLGSLEKRLNLLKYSPESMVAFGLVSYMSENGSIYKQAEFPFLRSTSYVSPKITLFGIFISPSYPLKQGCVLIRRSLVDKYPGIFDIDLFLRAVSCSKRVSFVNETCLNYRTFRGQFSSSRWKRTTLFFKLYWVRYAIRYLPWYVSPIASIYRILVELAKVVWCYISPRR